MNPSNVVLQDVVTLLSAPESNGSLVHPGQSESTSSFLRYRQIFVYAFAVIILGLTVYRVFNYLTSDLPPRGSGLKAIPGPWSTLPYIGRFHDIDPKCAFRAMKKFNDKYDGLFSLTLGGETHIWVGRSDIANDLLCKNAAICSGRADLGAYREVTKQYKYLPLLGYNEHLKQQRKFAHMLMTRNVNNNFMGYIGLETKRIFYEILKAPNDFYELTYLFCGRVTSRLAYGSDESTAAHVRNSRTFIHQLGPSGPITNLIPALGYLPEWLVPSKNDVRVRQEWEGKLWTTLFQRAKEEFKRGEGPYSYAQAYFESQRKENVEKPLFDEDQAVYAVGMLCIVAIFTIGGAAVLFIMTMILHPDWQEKVRKEIDGVVGNRLIELSDVPKLPILRAALKECLRWKSTVPLGVPRLLEDDYSYEGYHFPKHSVVHILDVALSRETSRYPDADSYKPERWLDEQYPTFKGPLTEYPRLKGHHIFGRGKRMCPGQDLAEAELLVFCGSLLKFFTLEPCRDENGNTLWPNIDKWGIDVIGGPQAFDCNIRIRDERMRGLVETVYQEAF